MIRTALPPQRHQPRTGSYIFNGEPLHQCRTAWTRSKLARAIPLRSSDRRVQISPSVAFGTGGGISTYSRVGAAVIEPRQPPSLPAAIAVTLRGGDAEGPAPSLCQRRLSGPAWAVSDERNRNGVCGSGRASGQRSRSLRFGYRFVLRGPTHNWQLDLNDIRHMENLGRRRHSPDHGGIRFRLTEGGHCR